MEPNNKTSNYRRYKNVKQNTLEQQEGLKEMMENMMPKN